MVIGHVSGFYGAKVLAERIREGIASHRFRVADVHYSSLSASIGVAPFPLCEHKVGLCRWEQVATIADHCAYLAKSSGRNAWISVSGTAALGSDDLPNLFDHLGALIQREAIQLDSSLSRDAQQAMLNRSTTPSQFTAA